MEQKPAALPDEEEQAVIDAANRQAPDDPAVNPRADRERPEPGDRPNEVRERGGDERSTKETPQDAERNDDIVDEASEDSFPASDPPAY